jgi:hypothetical protein
LLKLRKTLIDLVKPARDRIGPAQITGGSQADGCDCTYEIRAADNARDLPVADHGNPLDAVGREQIRDLLDVRCFPDGDDRCRHNLTRSFVADPQFREEFGQSQDRVGAKQRRFGEKRQPPIATHFAIDVNPANEVTFAHHTYGRTGTIDNGQAADPMFAHEPCYLARGQVRGGSHNQRCHLPAWLSFQKQTGALSRRVLSTLTLWPSG